MTPATTAGPLDAGLGYRFTYVVNHEAYWWPVTRSTDPRPKLMVMKSADGGGAAWEFAVVQRQFTVVDRTDIQVRVFGGAFAAYAEIAPFFAMLAERRPTTLEGVRAILDELGVVDATEWTEPGR